MYEQIKKQQSAAMRILENALIHQKMAHAYMICGDASTCKREMAIWLAQSYICDEQIACEECDICRRIANQTYSDCIWVDGRNKSIKKEDILHIQEEFNKTALEKNGRKVYILDSVENATAEALNSLLKFLEEPAQDVLAILIVEQQDRILPTILSRTQQLNLRKVSLSETMNQVLELGIDPLDSYISSAIAGNINQVEELIEDEDYQLMRIQTIRFIETYPDDPYGAIVELQNEFKEMKSNDRENMLILIQILQLFFKDVVQNRTICLSDKWKELLTKYDSRSAMNYFQICMEIKDKCNKSANIKLMLDSLMARFQEV